MSHTEVKNCQIVEIRLLNMKINKEKLTKKVNWVMKNLQK